LVNFPARETWLYRTPSGHAPVAAFLDSLPGKQVQKIGWVLRLFGDLGVLPAAYFKKLQGTESIWEIRVRTGGDAIRLLGFFDGPHRLVLTNGFSKKSQSVPKREIALAEQRRRDHLSRKGEDGQR
jgi:phage-related protein